MSELVLDEHEAGNGSPSLARAIPAVTDGPVTSPAADAAPDAPNGPRAPSVRQPARERWYAVHHEAFEGATVLEAVRSRGFEAFWPRRLVRRPRRDDVLSPIFPGYLFARFDAHRAGWGAIQHHPKVRSILGLRECGAPMPVPVGFVERLIEEAGGMDLPLRELAAAGAAHRFQLGDEVRVSLAGGQTLAGLIQEDDGARRVEVLLTLLGVPRVVQVERKRVRAA